MNCQNCGAPLSVVDGRNYLHCDYCATRSFLKSLIESDDGVAPLGRPGDGTCPNCRRLLDQAVLDTMRVEFCPDCRGILISNEVFSQVVRQRRSRFTGEPERPVPLNPEELRRTLDCPRCDRRMDVHPYYGPGNCVIDSCHRCRLVWLDHGEIAAIERAPGVR